VSDEAQLVAAVRASDTRAFERLYHEQYAYLCDVAYRYVWSSDAATDVVNTLFADLWAHRARFAVTGTIRQYLAGAVRHVAISRLRHTLVERRWRERVAAEHEIEPPAAWNEADAALAMADLRAAVRTAIADLPVRCRTAFLLRWERHLTYAEIAQCLEVSVKTVEAYMTRAYAALRAAPGLLLRLR
jgi:RNA polymerase sigma-70 factor, ECF subfamily